MAVSPPPKTVSGRLKDTPVNHASSTAPDNVTTKNTCRLCGMFPGGQSCSTLRTTDLRRADDLKCARPCAQQPTRFIAVFLWVPPKAAPEIRAWARGAYLAVLDWLVQPKPRWLGGNGWLLDGPEETLQAEACSTTEDGAEPLLCPSGYECHILSPGDMAEGIPNRGQCVKQRRQADGRFLRHKFHREYPEGDSKNVAEHGKGQQRHFQ
nr:WAP four-disulfide core domain protein 1 isoform X3 [Equus caballus]